MIAKQEEKQLGTKEVNRKYGFPMTRYGGLLEQALVEKEMSMKELADATLLSYEHIRLLVNGSRLPRPLVNKAICSALGIDEEEMNRVAKLDQLTEQYGDILGEVVQEAPTTDKLLQGVQNAWPTLTQKQRELIADEVAHFRRK